jgi:hypothetical protein
VYLLRARLVARQTGILALFHFSCAAPAISPLSTAAAALSLPENHGGIP